MDIQHTVHIYKLQVTNYNFVKFTSYKLQLQVTSYLQLQVKE
jgi:hypothetical protein